MPANVNEHIWKIATFLLVRVESLSRDRATEQPMISPTEGEELARRIGAVGYRECSALAQFGVEDVFAEAAKAAPKARSRTEMKRNKCCLLL